MDRIIELRIRNLRIIDDLKSLDDPDLHLHGELAPRVAWALEEVAKVIEETVVARGDGGLVRVADGGAVTDAKPMDRIIELRIRNLRMIDELTLDLPGLHVLIGANGSGKSTVLLALRMLCQLASTGSHASLPEYLGANSDRLTLGVSLAGAGPRVDYDVTLAMPVDDRWALVLEETVTAHGEGEPVRTHVNYLLADRALADARRRGLSLLDRPDDPASARARAALAAIFVQGGDSDYALSGDYRTAVDLMGEMLEHAEQQRLRDIERPRRRRKLLEHAEYDDGWLKLAQYLGWPGHRRRYSQGEMTYLEVSALCEVAADRCSLLAIDEPALHLHSSLAARVAWALQEVARRVPVLVATHSDALLNAFEPPATWLRVCARDARGALRLRRLNVPSWEHWLEPVGDLRAQGYLEHVLEPLPEAGGEP